MVIAKFFIPFTSQNEYNHTPFEKEINEFEKSLAITNENEKIKYNTNLNINYFNFDPNSASKNDWMEMGLTEKQINTIFNYIKKGGRFYKKEDLKKIYSINLNTYKKLEPYITIDTNKYEKKIKKKTIYYLDINSIDSIQLTHINGIGKILSKRIIKYRELLGGYVELKQLKEVYGFNPDLLKEFKLLFFIDSSKIKKININNVSKNDLQNHPYINGYNSEAIIAYRNFKGNIKNINELLINNLLEDSVYKRIKFYIKTE